MATEEDKADFEHLVEIIKSNLEILRTHFNEPEPDPDFQEEVLEDLLFTSYISDPQAPHRKAKRRALLKRLQKMVDDLEGEEGGRGDEGEEPEERSEEAEETCEE